MKDNKTIIRRLVLGWQLYDQCLKNGHKVSNEDLEERLEELKKDNHFKDCTVKDLVQICSLKEIPPCLEGKTIMDIKHIENPAELEYFIGFRDNPYSNMNLPSIPPTSYMPRDENGKPRRNCDTEEKVEHPDTAPILRLRNSKEIFQHYVCDLGQMDHVPEVREWMEEHPVLSENYRYALSEETYRWLKEFIMGHTQMGKTDLVMEFPPDIKAELQQFRLKKPVKAYRGVHFGMNKIDIMKQLCAHKLKPGYYYEYIDDRASSWTWNVQTAENFGKLGSFNYVLQCTFQPDDILIDCRLLNDYCGMIGDHRLQDEIIVLPGKYKCEVMEAPFNRNEMLRDENIPALQKLSALLNFIDHVPSKGRYGGYVGGLFGMLKFDASDDFVKRFGGDQNKGVYMLYEFRKDTYVKGRGSGYAVDYCVMNVSAKKEFFKEHSEYRFRNTKEDPAFYEFVNEAVKYLKHSEGDHRDDNMDAYFATYDMRSSKCDNICDEEYRLEGHEVHAPYTFRASTLDEVVNAFISDVMVLSRSFFMNKVCDYRCNEIDASITKEEAKVVLTPLRMSKQEIIATPSVFSFKNRMKQAKQDYSLLSSALIPTSGTLADFFYILDKLIFINVDYGNVKQFDEYVIKHSELNHHGAFYSQAREWSALEQDAITFVLLVDLCLLAMHNATAQQTVERAIVGMKKSEKGSRDAMKFFEVCGMQDAMRFLEKNI